MNTSIRYTLILISCVAIVALLFFYDAEDDKTVTSETEIKRTPEIQKQETLTGTTTKRSVERPKDTSSPDQKTELPEGVNPVFHDTPEIQTAWMEHGKDIVLKNYTEADSANFRNTFFHRGFKARPVTCGEVQFLSEGETINEYQRFVYTGVQSTYLEQDITNFHILWSRMCEETLDEYFDYQDERKQKMLEKSDN